MNNEKTHITKTADITRAWHAIDVSGKVLGRVATEIVPLLTGKYKPNFSRSVDCGDYVVVINAEKVIVTGRKEKQKIYSHHTGHPHGFRQQTLSQVRAEHPRDIIVHAVVGMLPKNKLRPLWLKRLRVFVGTTHPYKEKFKGNVK